MGLAPVVARHRLPPETRTKPHGESTTMQAAEAQVVRGLEGIVSHATEISEVDGLAGRLIVRGYNITELVGNVSFEEMAYLLWHGRLPKGAELSRVREEMARHRHLPDATIDVLRGPAARASGMHALRMAAATLSAGDPRVD